MSNARDVEYQEAEWETSRIEVAPGLEFGARVAEEQSLERLGKLCLSTPGLLLLKVSQAERRQEKGLRLQLQYKCLG